MAKSTLWFIGIVVVGALLGTFLGIQEAFELVVHDQGTSTRRGNDGLEFRYFSNFAGILTIGRSSFLFRCQIFELDQQHASASATDAQVRRSEIAVLLRGWVLSAASSLNPGVSWR
jgi:hypothetical protein